MTKIQLNSQFKKNSGSFAVTCIASEDRSIPDNCLMRHHRIISDVCSQVSQKAFWTKLVAFYSRATWRSGYKTV